MTVHWVLWVGRSIFVGILITTLSGSLGTLLNAQSLQDVQKKDPAYSAIQRSVTSGLLPLSSDNQFMPAKPVTRKEMALIIDRFQVLKKKFPLTQSEMMQLSELASSLKKTLMTQNTASNSVFEQFKNIQSEQKTLHYDLSRMTEEVSRLRQESVEQKKWLWIGFAVAAVGWLL